MKKVEGSSSLVSICVAVYSVALVILFMGANSDKLFATQEVKNDKVLGADQVELSEVFEKYSFGKNYHYDAVTVINVSTAVDDGSGEAIYDNTVPSSALTIAKGILDGTIVKNVLTSSDMLSYNNKLGLIQFSGDLYNKAQEIEAKESAEFSGELLVLPENTVAENIVVEEPVEEPVEQAVINEENKFSLDENGVPTNYVKYIDCTATAYCLCQKCTGKTPGSPGYGRTASGHVIIPGNNEKIIAVDSRMIPLGTNVYVQGLNGVASYGFALAADKGGAIKNNRIDLYMDSHADCLKWGRRQVRVYILPD